MLLQVHDELVFECPKDEINTVSNLIKKDGTGKFTFIPIKYTNSS